MKCANCSNPALYVYDPKPLRPTPYCSEHLPSFLRQAAKSGALPVTEAYEQTKREAIAALSPASPAVEPEAPTPAPKKRRRSAKKAPDAPAPESVEEEAAPEPQDDPQEPQDAPEEISEES